MWEEADPEIDNRAQNEATNGVFLAGPFFRGTRIELPGKERVQMVSAHHWRDYSYQSRDIRSFPVNKWWMELITKGNGRHRKSTRGGNTLLYRWSTSQITVGVGSVLEKREKARRIHVADIPASCPEPRLTVVTRRLSTTTQLPNILKQSTTTAKSRLGSARWYVVALVVI